MIAKLRKGLQDIRSRSSLTDQSQQPQRKFLRVASLELKKTLCHKVLEAARRRAEEMDAKIAELDAEESRILAEPQLSEQGRPHALPAPHSARDPESAPRRGFTMRY